MNDIDKIRLPRMGEDGDARMHRYPHGRGCGKEYVVAVLPEDVRGVVEQTKAMLDEAKRLVNKTIADVKQSVTSHESGGVNEIAFVLRDGSEKKAVVRNGRDADIEGCNAAIAAATKAADNAKAALREVSNEMANYESAERSRTIAENARKNNEKIRIEAESKRAIAEKARESAEKDRDEAMKAMAATFSGNESSRSEAFTRAQNSRENTFGQTQQDKESRFAGMLEGMNSSFQGMMSGLGQMYGASEQERNQKFEAAEAKRDEAVEVLKSDVGDTITDAQKKVADEVAKVQPAIAAIPATVDASVATAVEAAMQPIRDELVGVNDILESI